MIRPPSHLGTKLVLAVVAVSVPTLWCRASREAGPTPVLELAAVVDGGEATHAIDFEPYGGGLLHVHLGEPLRFAVARAWETVPCYSFDLWVRIQLEESDARRFDAWAAEHVDGEVAALVDGRVCMVAPFADVVGGTAFLSGGATGFRVDEVSRLVRSWNPVR